MTAEAASEIKELLHYEDETAGSLMTIEFVSIVANQTVRSAMYVLKMPQMLPRRFIIFTSWILIISLWALFL